MKKKLGVMAALVTCCSTGSLTGMQCVAAVQAPGQNIQDTYGKKENNTEDNNIKDNSDEEQNSYGQADIQTKENEDNKQTETENAEPEIVKMVSHEEKIEETAEVELYDAGENTDSSHASWTDTRLPSTDSNGQIYVNGLSKLPSNYSISAESSAEETILNLINEKRSQAGLKPLVMDNTLRNLAEYKSDYMIQANFFSHPNPDGTMWNDWYNAVGYNYSTGGENIAQNTSDPVALFNQWWNSAPHRENMMNPAFSRIGIGIINGNGQYMGTQMFSD